MVLGFEYACVVVMQSACLKTDSPLKTKNMNEHSPSIGTISDAISSSSAAHAATLDEVFITCYDNGIPPFLEAALPRLYGNIHSTMAQLEIYGGLTEIMHTYVARKGNRIVAIFLFRRDGGRVQVVNEGMRIDDEEMDRFATYVFSRWPSVQTISMYAVETALKRIAFPHQCYACTSNIVLPLPGSVEEYLASLGKNMRRNLRRYMDKLKRSFPSFRYDVFEKEAINEEHVHDILRLNRVRIADKRLAFGLESEIEKIVALTKRCGLVGVATIDGQVIGGAVGYLVGENYFFKVIAHDPKYNEYSAGILCCYLTICECITRGCKEYNFMWSGYEYKFALGAYVRSLHRLVVYRSRVGGLRNVSMVAQVAFNGYRYKLASLLGKTGKPETLSPVARTAARVLNGLRKVKKRAADVMQKR